MLASALLASAAIFHGSPVADTPWFASLQQGGPFCGGALIAPDRVLTAAHCVQGNGPRDFSVVLNRRTRPIRGTYFPTRYRLIPSPVAPQDIYASASVHDIAIVVLRTRVTDVTPLALAPTPPADAEPTLTVGRGITGPEELPAPAPLSAAQQVLPSAACKAAYGTKLLHAAFHLCTKDPTRADAQSCAGDSGSPVMVRRGGVLQVAGVVTWGGETQGKVCGRSPADVSERTLAHAALLTGAAPRTLAPYNTGYVERTKAGCRRGSWHPANVRLTVKLVRRGSRKACRVTARSPGGWTAEESYNAL